jgi:hypothetical protein
MKEQMRKIELARIHCLRVARGYRLTAHKHSVDIKE